MNWKKLFSLKINSRVKNIEDESATNQNLHYLKLLNKKLKKNSSNLSDVIELKREDFLGLKTLSIYISEILNPNYGILPIRYLELINNQKELMNEDEFGDWCKKLLDRINSYELKNHINIRDSKMSPEIEKIRQLSNLDLMIIRNNLNREIFDCLLFLILDPNRLFIIFGNFDLKKFNQFQELKKDTVQINQEAKFICHQIESKKYNKRIYISPRQNKFLEQFFEGISQDYLSKILQKKSDFELAMIMLELSVEHKTKFFSAINLENKEKINYLFSPNRVVFRDNNFLYRFIKEVENLYFKGDYSLCRP